MAGNSSTTNLDYTREDVEYDSTNEDDEDNRNAKRARRDLAEKPKTDRKSKAKVTSEVGKYTSKLERIEPIFEFSNLMA